MTKYWDEHVKKGRGKTPQNDKVVIDTGDYDEDPVREWQCPNCNYRLHARKSRKEIDCPNCTATLDLGGATQETKTLDDPNKDNAAKSELYLWNTPDPTNPWEKKGPELKGGFKVLRDRGLRITNYYDSSYGKEGAD